MVYPPHPMEELMKEATNRKPVMVLHPVTEQYVAVQRGTEFDDNDALVEAPANAWLFEPEAEPEDVRSVPIEQATRAPGEVRTGRLRGRSQQ